MRTVNSADFAVLIFNQIRKSYSLPFLQTRMQPRLSVLWYFYDSSREKIYSSAVFFASFMLGHIVPTVNSIMDKNEHNSEWHKIIALLSLNTSVTGLAKTRKAIMQKSWKTLAIFTDMELNNTTIAFLVQIKENICKKLKRRR